MVFLHRIEFEYNRFEISMKNSKNNFKTAKVFLNRNNK